MAKSSITDLLTPVVRQAVRDFATAAGRTTEYRAFAQAHEQFLQDEAARQAIEAYQSRLWLLQESGSPHAMSAEDRAELESLRQIALCQPSLEKYSEAEEDLKRLCRTLAESLSVRIGLDLTDGGECSSCSEGCCG